jgi:molybdopterin-biosynthesis enzyme MoeA-like protein
VVPPVRFRRFGGESAYCTWAQLVVFTGGLVTNMDDGSLSRAAADAGAQLDFRLVFFSALESTLSFAYARAAEKREKMTDEFMVSVKILR